MAGAAYRRVTPRPLITDGDLSKDITTDWVDVQGLNQITVHYKWSGTDPVGEMKVEADVSAPPHKTANAYDIPLSPSASVDSDDGADTIVLTGPLSRWRIKWVATSGTGTLNAYWQGHQV